LKNYNEVQMTFINRIGNFIAEQGFRMMGWNEIYGKNVGHGEYTMEDSGFKLNKQAIVHFWKGSPDLLKEVAENGYDLVYSDNLFTYTTFSYKSIPLSKAYRSSPVPEGLKPEYINHVLGIECPMWTENSIRTTGFYPYVFPRIAAYAEVGWTHGSHKDYSRFTGSLWKLKKHWDEKGILYSDSID
jgi:hexosaminidase